MTDWEILTTNCVYVHSQSDADAMLNPLLSWEHSVIDHGLGIDVDEGEERLKSVRDVLRACKVEMDADGVPIFSGWIHERDTANVYAATFCETHSWKPRVRLVAPQSRLVDAKAVDALDEKWRVGCLAVKGSDQVAVRLPQEHLPTPKVLLTYARRSMNNASIDGHVQLTRRSPAEVSIIASSVSTTRNAVVATVAPDLLDKLFALSAQPSTSTVVPGLPGELPDSIACAIADFWQRELRLHVMATVCAPGQATRPLAFDLIKAARDGVGGRATVHCILHPSSIKCACRLHGLEQMSKRFPGTRFSGSQVEFSLSMCGRAVTRLPDGQFSNCVVCRSNTRIVPQIPGVCVAQTASSVSCSHTKVGGGGRASCLWIPSVFIGDAALLKAQLLIAAAMRSAEKLGPLLGKSGPEEIQSVCQIQSQRLIDQLDEIMRVRVTGGEASRSDAEMLALDIKAVDHLRAKNVRQHVRPSTREVVLAQFSPDGTTCVLTGEEASLAETHIGLFPPPPPGGKRPRG